MKWWIVGGVAFVFVSLFLWLYNAVGLKEYLTAIIAMKRLPSEQQAKAWDTFFTLNEPNLYGGILAGYGGGKIWVWGRQGLRSFQPDIDSVYSFFSACTPEILAKANNGEPFTVERTVYSSMAEWQPWLKTGRYVTVAQATEASGGTMGNLRELYLYDWWVFLPGVLSKQCAN